MALDFLILLLPAGALAYTNADFAHVIKLVAEKKINTEGLITAKIPVSPLPTVEKLRLSLIKVRLTSSRI